MASACHSACKEARMGTTLEREVVRSSEIENRRYVYITFRPYWKDAGELIHVCVGRREERSDDVLSSQLPDKRVVNHKVGEVIRGIYLSGYVILSMWAA